MPCSGLDELPPCATSSPASSFDPCREPLSLGPFGFFWGPCPLSRDSFFFLPSAVPALAWRSVRSLSSPRYVAGRARIGGGVFFPPPPGGGGVVEVDDLRRLYGAGASPSLSVARPRRGRQPTASYHVRPLGRTVCVVDFREYRPTRTPVARGSVSCDHCPWPAHPGGPRDAGHSPATCPTLPPPPTSSAPFCRQEYSWDPFPSSRAAMSGPAGPAAAGGRVPPVRGPVAWRELRAR